MKLPYVINLMGPTASGKTKLAMYLADHFDAEIISVDSAMIYQGMDIGTAKPTADELRLYPHYLIDLVDPKDAFSVSDFLKALKPIIDQSHKNNKLPILVGGTMMYFNAFMHGLTELPEADELIRARLTKEGQTFGWPLLHQKLALIDPSSAKNIKPTDSQRIVRALEVYEMTQKPMSLLWETAKSHALSAEYQVIQLGLMPEDRAKLHELINLRFKLMLQSGFIDEVKMLYDRGDLDETLPSIRCVGYRQIWQYLDGMITFDDAVEKAMAATRQLAKRQMTWLRHWQSIYQCFDAFDPALTSKVMKYLEQKIGI